MPYINKTRREIFNSKISELASLVHNDPLNTVNTKAEYKAVRPGDLNYIITKLLLESFGSKLQQLRYSDYNEIIGLLESCKLEFYRRQVGPYEDTKKEQEGDV